MIDWRSPRVARSAAVALLLLVLGLAAEAILVPIADTVRSELEQRRLLLKEARKLRGLVEAAPELHKVLAQVDGHPMWQRVYQGNPQAAEADLQKDLRALAEAQGIRLDTLQPLDVVSDRDFSGIRLRVAFNTSIDHLGQLLAAMQASTRFMTFEDLYVTSPMSQSGSGNQILVVHGDVLAYAMPEAMQ